MELITTPVETAKSLLLPDRDEALIMPLGDIQLDPDLTAYGVPRSCDIERLRKHVQWGVDRGAYFLGMGDYVDVASPSNRAKLKAVGFYDNITALMEKAAFEAEDELKEILAPTRGRWLGLLEGHHFFEYESGQTTDTRLAEWLGCPHLGTSTLVNVRFPRERGRGTPNFTVWAHHGRGGGKLLSGPLNQLEHVLKSFEADVYLVGHHHKQVAGKYQRLVGEFPYSGKPRLRHKSVILASTGSFLRGYTQGSKRGMVPRGGYVEQGLMNPVALGGLAIWARPRYSGGTASEAHYASVDLDVSL